MGREKEGERSRGLDGLDGGKQRPASKLAAVQRRRIRRRWRRRVVGRQSLAVAAGPPDDHTAATATGLYNSERRER